MRISKVHLDKYGRPAYKAEIGAGFFRKAALLGALSASLIAGGYAYEATRQARAGSYAVPAAQGELAPSSLEEMVHEDTPLPDASVARLYSSNLERRYAESNVAELQRKGINAYLSEAFFKGNRYFRTLIKAEQDKQHQGHEKMQKPAQEPENQVDYDSLHSVEKIIYDKVEEYNEHHPGNEIDFNLARAIAYCESTYKPNARSHKKAKGLFQIIKPTAEKIGGRKYTDKELLDKNTNIELGLKYIGYLQCSPHVNKGKTEEARLKRLLAAYNGGEPAILPSDDNPRLLRYQNLKNWRYRQTRRYVPKVMAVYESFSSDSS